MPSLNTWLQIVVVLLLAAALTMIMLRLIQAIRWPSVDSIIDGILKIAPVFNSKGGIILLLTFMWFMTLGATVAICLWAIIHGVDPQNGVLIVLLSVLTSGAWGNVNGAWLKTMTGEDLKPVAGTTTDTVVHTVIPTVPEQK